MNFNIRRGFVLTVVASLLFVSCANFENISIGEIQEFKVAGFEENYLKLNVSVQIDNPTIHKINIKEIDVRVFINQQYIGKLLIDQPVLIKPKSSQIYELPVKIRLANILNTAFIMMNLGKGQRVEFGLEGNVIVKSMLITRYIEIKESRIIKM